MSKFCPYCGLSYSNTGNLNKHIKKKHSTNSIVGRNSKRLRNGNGIEQLNFNFDPQQIAMPDNFTSTNSPNNVQDPFAYFIPLLAGLPACDMPDIGAVQAYFNQSQDAGCVASPNSVCTSTTNSTSCLSTCPSTNSQSLNYLAEGLDSLTSEILDQQKFKKRKTEQAYCPEFDCTKSFFYNNYPQSNTLTAQNINNTKIGLANPTADITSWLLLDNCSDGEELNAINSTPRDRLNSIPSSVGNDYDFDTDNTLSFLENCDSSFLDELEQSELPDLSSFNSQNTQNTLFTNYGYTQPVNNNFQNNAYIRDVVTQHGQVQADPEVDKTNAVHVFLPTGHKNTGPKPKQPSISTDVSQMLASRLEQMRICEQRKQINNNKATATSTPVQTLQSNKEELKPYVIKSEIRKPADKPTTENSHRPTAPAPDQLAQELVLTILENPEVAPDVSVVLSVVAALFRTLRTKDYVELGQFMDTMYASSDDDNEEEDEGIEHKEQNGTHTDTEANGEFSAKQIGAQMSALIFSATCAQQFNGRIVGFLTKMLELVDKRKLTS